MFITGIKLVGFQRLVHNNIHKVSILYTSIFQIILGRNGSGKSSVMGELTPYPSHKDLYAENGSRELSFTHRGSSWVTIDDFATGKHSIWKDGVLLHDNLTPTMMKGLVKELFGIDKLLSDILTDRKKFTTMTPAERREIIMRASGINIDLGVEILDKLKDRKSYYKEYSKNLSKRLVAEDNSLPTDSHIEELNKRKEDILADLKVLDELSTQYEILDHRSILDKKLEIEDYGRTIAYRFMDTPEVLHGALDRHDVSEIEVKLKNELFFAEGKKRETTEEIDALSVSLGKNRFSKTKEDLIKELDFTDKEILELDKASKGFIYVGDEHKLAVETSQELYEELRELFDTLPDNTNRFFNPESIQRNTDNLIRLNNSLGIIHRSISEIEMGIKQHKDGEPVECPSCKNNFIPGVMLSETTLKERLEIQTIRAAELNREIAIAKEYDVAQRSYNDQLARVGWLNQRYFLHQLLFTKLRQYDYTVNPPKHCFKLLEDWFNDIGKSSRYNELLTRRSKLKEDINFASAEDLEQRRLEDEKFNRLEKVYSQLIDTATAIKAKLKSIKDYTTYLDQLDNWLGRATVFVGEIDEYKDQLLKNSLNQFTSNAKAELNNELGRIEKEITSIQYTMLNRERLTADKSESDLKSEDLSIIHEELSPKTGLLGDVMNEFIDKSVAQMNNFIKSIWTYEVKILPCRNKKGDLDWYFPVSVAGGVPSADVAETSTGEQHLCNFVFKLLIMATYNLKDYPLFLDELAGNMDDLHRVKIMKSVYDMVTNGYCTQMFLIAHYEQQYGMFTQAEIFITNPENLQTIPENYNSHAKIS